MPNSIILETSILDVATSDVNTTAIVSMSTAFNLADPQAIAFGQSQQLYLNTDAVSTDAHDGDWIKFTVVPDAVNIIHYLILNVDPTGVAANNPEYPEFGPIYDSTGTILPNYSHRFGQYSNYGAYPGTGAGWGSQHSAPAFNPVNLLPLFIRPYTDANGNSVEFQHFSIGLPFLPTAAGDYFIAATRSWETSGSYNGTYEIDMYVLHPNYDPTMKFTTGIIGLDGTTQSVKRVETDDRSNQMTSYDLPDSLRYSYDKSAIGLNFKYLHSLNAASGTATRPDGGGGGTTSISTRPSSGLLYPRGM
jgi:hypothetical protein